MTDARMQKARWRSRRGMRELDVLLSNFIDERFSSLPECDVLTLEALLEESDIDLYSWLTRRSEPEDAGYSKLIRQIRDVSPRTTQA